MSKLTWSPWHRVVQLRDDIRSGELSLYHLVSEPDGAFESLRRRLFDKLDPEKGQCGVGRGRRETE